MKHILFNFCSPSKLEIPATGLSRLKGFLKENGIHSTIIYWNILVKQLLNNYTGTDDITLIPFFYKTAIDANDATSLQRIEKYLDSRKQFFSAGQPANVLEIADTWYNKIKGMIIERLREVDFTNIGLVGISAKHYQWIASVHVAKIIKGLHPEIRIVLGGFDDASSSEIVMNTFKEIDFAIWGEGELPLLELYKQLENSENNFHKVPNMLYYADGRIVKSVEESSACTSLESIYSDRFDDYFTQIPEAYHDIIEIPIEASRGCFWGRCNFCGMNASYNKIRRRSPESFVTELDELIQRYGFYKFRLADNSANANKKEFTVLLNHLISLNRKYSNKIGLLSEITPFNMDEETIKLMALAGFIYVEIGFEALNDEIMVKLNKINRFADNLLFVKFALKYGIRLSSQIIIIDYPKETEEEILESQKNLHYLRYFVKKNVYGLRPINMKLEKNSPFAKKLSTEELDHYNVNILQYLMPASFFEKYDTSSFFGSRGTSKHQDAWEELFRKHQEYLDHEYSYEITNEGANLFTIKEYIDGTAVNTVRLEKPLFADILREVNDRVRKFEDIYNTLSPKYDALTREALREAIQFLASHYFVYHNKKMTQIVSVVDFTAA